MSDEEMARTNIYLPVEAKRLVKERDDTTISESCRRGLEAGAFGEPYVEYDVLNGETADHLEKFYSAFNSVLTATEQQSVNGMMAVEEVQKLLFDHFGPVGHAMARSNHERRRQVDSAQFAEPEERVEEDDLERLEQETVREGVHVFPDHGRVQEVAPPGVTGEEVVTLLKERNPDLPDELFEERSWDDGTTARRRR